MSLPFIKNRAAQLSWFKSRAGHTRDNLTPFKGHSDTERQTFVWNKGLNKLSHCRLLEHFKMSHTQLSLYASVIRTVLAAIKIH